MRPGKLVLGGALLALTSLGAGCDEQPAPRPLESAVKPSPAAPSPTPDPDSAPGDPAPQASPEALATPPPGPSAPATPSDNASEAEAAPRDLDAILFELEEIEGTGPNLHDPEADYEARYERVEDLAVEAAGFGVATLPLVHKRLVEARELAQESGYRQRPAFLAHVFARIAASDEAGALEETAKLLATLTAPELEDACAQLPRGSRDAVLAAWLGQLSSPPGPREGGLRLALLKRYAAKVDTPDAALLDTLAKDPDAAVAAAANELLAR